MDGVFSSLSAEERSRQKTPLCQTPTSQLLQLAAQFLPTPPSTPSDELNPKAMDIKPPSAGIEPNEHQSTDIFNVLKEGWWQASPSQLQEVSESIRNSGLVEKMAQVEMDANTVSMVDALVDANIAEPDQFDFSAPDGNNNEKTKPHGSESDYSLAIHSLSAAIAMLREQNKQVESPNPVQDETKPVEDAANTVDKPEPDTYRSTCPRPLQPGSYWYSKKFHSPDDEEKELPSNSTEEVRKVLASLAVSKPGTSTLYRESNTKMAEFGIVHAENNITPQASIDISESLSMETIVQDSTAENSKELNDKDTVPLIVHKNEIGQKLEDNFDLELQETEELVRNNVALQMDSHKQTKYIEHNIDNCVAADCMCYEAVFRQDQPIETSSIKSDSSFTESLESSPTKSMKKVSQKLSSSSVSDESVNSSLNKRRSRIAARFGTPIE